MKTNKDITREFGTAFWFAIAVGGGIFVAIYCMLLLGGCGIKASGQTTHKVEGQAEVRLVIDLTVCDQVPEGEERTVCIQKLLDILAAAQKAKVEETDEPNNVTGVQ